MQDGWDEWAGRDERVGKSSFGAKKRLRGTLSARGAAVGERVLDGREQSRSHTFA